MAQDQLPSHIMQKNHWLPILAKGGTPFLPVIRVLHYSSFGMCVCVLCSVRARLLSDPELTSPSRSRQCHSSFQVRPRPRMKKLMAIKFKQSFLIPIVVRPNVIGWKTVSQCGGQTEPFSFRSLVVIVSVRALSKLMSNNIIILVENALQLFTTFF